VSTAARRKAADEDKELERVLSKFASATSIATANQLRDELFQHQMPELRADLAPLKRPVKPRPNTFWHEEETDNDLITDEVGEDDFEEDDILSLGHGKLEEHREYREYARIAVWEMPLLSSEMALYLSQPAAVS
jgi:small subunit ribosomal protein S35